MTNRRSFPEQTAAPAALGTPWLTAEGGCSRRRAPSEYPGGCAGRCPSPGPRAAIWAEEVVSLPDIGSVQKAHETFDLSQPISIEPGQGIVISVMRRSP